MPSGKPLNVGKINQIAQRAAREDGFEVITGRDSAMQRHGKELFGVQAEVDFTPPELRYVEPGHVLVEWIGDVGPLADEQIAGAIQLGVFSKTLVEAYHKFTRVVTNRIDGVSTRTVTAERDHMTQTYRWGAKLGSYILQMRNVDADRLFSTPCAHEFRMVGKDVIDTPRPTPIERFVPGHLQEKVLRVVVVKGPHEPLLGMHPNLPRIGFWGEPGSQ